MKEPLACARPRMRVSFLIPSYNERATILEVLDRIEALGLDRQLIVVDDGSTDGTGELLREWESGREGVVLITAGEQGQGRGDPGGDPAHRRRDRGDPGRRHGVRPGRRARACRADRAGSRRRRVRLTPLGRPPSARLPLLAPRRQPFPVARDRAPLQHDPQRHGDGLQGIPQRRAARLDLRQSDFSIEPEITAKICKRDLRIYQLPISYYGRTYAEGKKITWRDGFKALWVLLRVRLRD